jgi:hypothetical protein
LYMKLTPAIGFVAACAVAFVVYLQTIMPGLGFWDTGEFQTVCYILGIAHPTGFPLYILIGKLFTFLPFGSVAYRLNLMSALCASAAVGLLAALTMRVGAQLVVGLVAALSFAFSLNLWLTANRADPHTLNLAVAAALWLVALNWAEQPERRWLVLLAFGAGLGLGNHVVLATELPALAVYVLLANPRRLVTPSNLFPALGGFFLGLTVYLYLPVRAWMHPALNYGNPGKWAGFRYLVFAEQFRSAMGFLSIDGLGGTFRQMPELGAWYGEWLTVRGAIAFVSLAVLGLAIVLVRYWRLGIGLLLGFAVPFFAASNYINGDLARYFLMPNLILFWAAAVGLQAIVSKVGTLFHFPPLGWTISWLLALSLLVLPYQLMKINFARADHHLDRGAESCERALLASFKPNAVVFSWWSYSTPLWYGRYVEGARPDVRIIDDSDLIQDNLTAEQAIGRYLKTRPVYAIALADGLERLRRRYRLELLPKPDGSCPEVYSVLGGPSRQKPQPVD